MKRLVYLLSITLLISCGEDSAKVEKPADNAGLDTIPRVTGIGGIFFESSDPEMMNEWYGNNLGMAMDDYGSPFEFRNANDPDQKNYLRWSVFPENSGYVPNGKQFMINYRVNNLIGLVKKLEANGVVVLDSIETYPYGKFVHILDPDSNKIELWEPVDDYFTQMGGETTK